MIMDSIKLYNTWLKDKKYSGVAKMFIKPTNGHALEMNDVYVKKCKTTDKKISLYLCKDSNTFSLEANDVSNLIGQLIKIENTKCNIKIISNAKLLLKIESTDGDVTIEFLNGKINDAIEI